MALHDDKKTFFDSTAMETDQLRVSIVGRDEAVLKIHEGAMTAATGTYYSDAFSWGQYAQCAILLELVKTDAEDPQIVVGAIVEFAEHGSRVAPIVTRIMARYLLGPDAGKGSTADYRIEVPSDSAPAPLSILPDSALLRSLEPDTTRGTPRL